MKVSLWILGCLLGVDVLFLSYFWVFRRDYYFPGRYEEAFAATACGLLAGIILIIPLLVMLVLFFRTRRRDRKRLSGTSPNDNTTDLSL